MQESARAAWTYARSKAESLGVAERFYETKDVHIHVPAGAIPKDGPSAGVTIAVSLVSALTERPVPSSLGMTGEITLRRRVLPVGGIKEKVLAAHGAGARKIILPSQNQSDLDDVPDHVKEDLEFIPIDHIDQAIEYALGISKVDTNPALTS
jgi:ATP-dependent Lon protease